MGMCQPRTPASGACVKNSNDECTKDSDCTGGGCGGELCYNPDVSSGISTCECTEPTAVTGCGCVNNKCTWYN
jgi:eight-cysteine-cluster-containing protein